MVEFDCERNMKAMNSSRRQTVGLTIRIVQRWMLSILLLLIAAACTWMPMEPESSSPTAEPTGTVSSSSWPQSQEACEEAGGRWQQLGLIGVGCNLPTTDGGQPCDTVQDCQGLCLPDDPNTMNESESGVQIPDTDYIQQVNESGRGIEGVCSQWQSTFGCIVVVEAGRYEEICID